MTDLDLTRASTTDLAVALRSYPRRFRAAVLPLPDDDTAVELATRPDQHGHSALERVVHATHTWVLLERSLDQLAAGTPLHPAVIDGALRSWEVPPGTTVPDALERLGEAATAIAERIEHLRGRGLHDEGPVAGGGTISALGIAQEAVRVGHDDLVAATAAMAAARR